MQGGADGPRARLKDLEQIEPAYRGKTNAVDLDTFAPQAECHVLPALHPGGDRVHRVGIVSAQEFKRLIGKDNAEAPGGVGRVLFEQVDARFRMMLLPEIAEIEAAGASADNGDTHDGLPD